ncbi:acyl-CoA dehydrogenase family protein [Novosphingobium sp.]|uniref:acyl-CoA dehydrogenase family protein n=1 Tax=Novosphingobium sp. TaxID=1874826 RepID=UPI0035B49139
MDLTLDTEQEAFLAATTDWCRDNMPLEQARSRPAGLWAELEAMGWTGMTAPGMDLSHATEALVFAELGRHIAPIGLIPTAVAARWSVHPGKTALALLDRHVEGGRLRLFDPEGASQALGLVGNFAATTALPADLGGAPGLDPSAHLAHLDPVPPFEALGDPRAALHLQLLAAAYALGCADAARDMAAEYAKVREQFDRPIGWFQALKHICADMAVRCAVARSQLIFAACALDAGQDDAAFHIAAAKQLADQAAIENGRANVQVHGGIGMTDEAYPHFCLKRAHLLSFIAPVRREIILGEAA